jgi:hypothetical protein
VLVLVITELAAPETPALQAGAMILDIFTVVSGIIIRTS